MAVQNIAIIGASAAGVAAALALRKADFRGTITLYDRDPNLPYERPPLSKALADRPGLLKPIAAAEVYSDLEIDLCLGAGVRSLSTERVITLDDGQQSRHDQVLLTTGVSARRLDVPGRDLANVVHLRNSADASRLSSRLEAGGPLVIVGGGFIGLELAAVARSLGLDVTVVELAPLPLQGVVGPAVARLFTSLHLDAGVKFVTESSVSAFLGSEEVEGVELIDGRRLPAATVVVGVGVVPNTHLARGVGLECPGGISVDPFGRTSLPWLWAAGDVTVRDQRFVRRRGRIEHWDSSQRHGDAVGRSLGGIPTEETAVPYVWSDQYNLTYQGFGRIEPSDRVVFRRSDVASFLVFFLDETSRVRAVTGIGHPREVRAGKTLIEKGSIVDPAALADPCTDIKRLAKGTSPSMASPVR
ncbi:NAD(P)/FAD-dependent oxidoreductase [Granulicoccus phenolivorans]|uniref:NAD(P)/FAD-dependent oxidoreductase n=1 Tax=Granulicoccus phenolivorans TaxID=266854 RepID=UPI000424BE06|nr:FAD-dependent oxidoreductase [Granulicoccus phenolivorans]